MTDLPFVHLLCAGKKGAWNPGVADLLRNVGDAGGLLPAGLAVGFDDDVRSGLEEFLRYSFYHGVLPDIPDIEMFEEVK
jgi:hypothetical protein